MRRPADDLLSDALALPEDQRLALASELLASVEGPGDPDWDRAWLAELDRRAEDADRGEVETEDWSAVRSRVVAHAKQQPGYWLKRTSS